MVIKQFVSSQGFLFPVIGRGLEARVKKSN